MTFFIAQRPNIATVAVDNPKVYGPLAPDTEPAIEALSREQAQRSIGWSEEKALGLKPKNL
jgi:hypothetical protein